MSTVVDRLCDRCLDVVESCDAQGDCVAMGQLGRGQCGTVAGFQGVDDMTVSRRLFDLGFAKGVEVELIRRAPLGDPLMFRVGNSDMLLRRSEADLVVVRVA
ncbi:hypothetical protein GCM10009785_24830 [Brooklawnia cerclae]|uniref:Ferrous iron transport protein A n=1 Tax=Brooklawnia cerclae TaxID=349934 RepID=A0ABX0SB51_9ACTN|nr:FeoA family protein [Brooklawnia cerclae]NIH55554.1 ferrous iron transport protein A [Brooklawnia cerclae]